MEKEKCLIKVCPREVSSRGLCNQCYITAKKLVKDNRSDWATLEAHGLCLASKRKEYEKGVFMKAFIEKAKIENVIDKLEVK